MAIYAVRERASRESLEGGRRGLAGRRMDLDVEWKRGNGGGSGSGRQRRWYAVRGDREEEGG